MRGRDIDLNNRDERLSLQWHKIFNFVSIEGEGLTKKECLVEDGLVSDGDDFCDFSK